MKILKAGTCWSIEGSSRDGRKFNLETPMTEKSLEEHLEMIRAFAVPLQEHLLQFSDPNKVDKEGEISIDIDITLENAEGQATKHEFRETSEQVFEKLESWLKDLEDLYLINQCLDEEEISAKSASIP